MKRRESLSTLAALFVALGAAGCGGGSGSAIAAAPAPTGSVVDAFASNKSSYLVAESASATATSSGGAGRIDPGAIPATSGTLVQVRSLPGNANYWQVITSGQTQVRRPARKEHTVLLIGGVGNGRLAIASAEVLE